MNIFALKRDGLIYDKFLLSLNKIRPNLLQWLAGFCGIIFVRFFLESLSSPTTSGFIASDPPTLLHYALFYGAATLAIMFVLRVFSGGKLNAPFLALAGLSLIWLAPLLDLILSRGAGRQMAYLVDGPRGLFANLFRYFGPLTTPGITSGMRIEIAVILAVVGGVVWLGTRRFWRSAGAVAATYILLFAFVALPGIVYATLGAPYGPARLDSIRYFQDLSQTPSLIANILHGTLAFGTKLRLIELGFDAIFGRILYLLLFALVLFWFFVAERKKLVAVLKNCRPERVLFYWSFLVFGLASAPAQSISWPDWLGILCLFLAWFSAWMFAVHSNDIEDTAIDAVSNPGRPITAGALSSKEMRGSGYAWLFSALIGAFLAGYYPFYMVLVYTAAYYIYSVPPLRLKRIPFLSSFLISLAVLSTVLAGFFFASYEKRLDAFPIFWTVGIILIFSLAVNIRDLKDVEGDRKEGIGTLPVLLGRTGERLTGIFLAVSFILVPVFLKLPVLFLVAAPAATAAYLLAARKPYHEKYIFILYFAFAAAAALICHFVL